MRLDKYITSTGILTRSQCKQEIKKGLIVIDGKPVKDPGLQIDEETVKVYYKNKIVEYKKYTYIMMNKPKGYISSTEDFKQKTVLDLLPDNYKRIGLFPCGRLDIDTTGLLILTNNGDLAHKLLSPKFHVPKTYYFECSPAIDENKRIALENGVDIGEDHLTKTAKIVLNNNYDSGKITITEGKFHQIKRMFQAVGSEIVELKRISFSKIELDESLKEGSFRLLNETEEESLVNYNN